MLLSRFSLLIGIGFVVLCALPARSQPTMQFKPIPAPKKAPLVNAEAKSLVEAMLARYQALTSYSDKTQVQLEGGGALPKDMRDGFPVEATLIWQRPGNLRFEGKAGKKDFLGLSDGKTVRAINPEHAGLWLERDQKLPVAQTDADEKQTTETKPQGAPRLEDAWSDTGVIMFGLSFMNGPEYWNLMTRGMTVLALEPDAEMDGQMCRVVNVQAEGKMGSFLLMRLWIGREDKLLRRFEMSDTVMGANSKFIETHSQVRANPELPAATWEFVPPAGRTKVAEFAPQTNG